MSYQLTVIYHHPDDPAAFDEHYASTHAPLASKIPGLRSLQRPAAGPGPRGRPRRSTSSRCWSSTTRPRSVRAWAAPRARRPAGTSANFATGGVTMLAGEVTTYV